MDSLQRIFNDPVIRNLVFGFISLAVTLTLVLTVANTPIKKG